MGPDKTNSVMNERHDDRRPKAGKVYGELVPRSDLVYIEPDLKKATLHVTTSGLYVKTDKPKYQGPPNSGTVLAIGKDIKNVHVGDKVVFKDPNGKGFWLNDIAHIPVKEEQIIAIIGAES